MAMKLTKLKTWFLSALLGVSLCSFTSKTNSETAKQNDINDNNSPVVLSETNIGSETSDISAVVKNYSITDIGASFQLAISTAGDGVEKNFCIGYEGEGEEYLPGSLQFFVRDSSGNLVQRTAKLNRVRSSSNFDGIGSRLGGSSITTFCDIPLAANEELVFDDTHQVLLFNIYNWIEKVDNEDVFDFASPMYAVCNLDSILNPGKYPTTFDEDDYFSLAYAGASNYSGFAAFAFNVENFGIEKYPTLTSGIERRYRDYEERISEGTAYVRSLLSFAGGTYFDIEYADGTTTRVTSTSKKYEITNGGQVVLLLENIDVNNVVNVVISGLYYEMNIFNRTTNAAVSSTTFSQRFGQVYTRMTDLQDSTGNVAVNKSNNTYLINNDLIVGLVFGISTFIFFAIVVPAYFILKKKNRNDEFKRMNTKSYVTTATYGYLCIESLLLLITFVVIRATIFNNSLTVFNPTDAYIIVFGVMAIILVGYFIRYFVIEIKNNIEKKRRDRLNINHDVIDDGTLIIRK